MLLIIWLSALFVLSSTLAYAHFFIKKTSGAPQVHVPSDFSEFIALELREILIYVKRVAHAVRPHANRALGYTVAVSRRGGDMFIERVFGRTEITKGKTTSFYLKHISEHKDVRGGSEDTPVQ